MGKGFTAQVYITKDCLKNYPVYAQYYQFKVVDSLPTIKPYERSLEWVVSTKPSATKEPLSSEPSPLQAKELLSSPRTTDDEDEKQRNDDEDKKLSPGYIA